MPPAQSHPAQQGIFILISRLQLHLTVSNNSSPPSWPMRKFTNSVSATQTTTQGSSLAISMPGLMVSCYWVQPAQLHPWFKSHAFKRNLPSMLLRSKSLWTRVIPTRGLRKEADLGALEHVDNAAFADVQKPTRPTVMFGPYIWRRCTGVYRRRGSRTGATPRSGREALRSWGEVLQVRLAAPDRRRLQAVHRGESC